MNYRSILWGVVFSLAGTVSVPGQILLSSSPTTAVATGHAELVGTIRFTAGASGAIADTLTVRYAGLAFANDQASGITLAADGWGASIASVDKANGTITVSAPATSSGNYFEIRGARISFAGLTVSEVKAKVTTTGNPLFVGGFSRNEVTVVEAVSQGLSVDPAGSVFVVKTAVLASSKGTLKVSEGFAAAFTDAVGSLGQDAATQVRIQMQGLPSSSTLTFPSTVTESATSATLTAVSGSELTLPTSKGETTITYVFKSGTGSSSNKESFEIVYDLKVDKAPGEEVAVSLQASLFPSDATTSVPRYTTRYLPRDEELPLPEFIGYVPAVVRAGEFLGVAFTNLTEFANPVELQLFDRSGQLIAGSGITNPATLTLATQNQRSLLLEEIFGSPVRSAELGTVLARTRRARAASMFLIGDNFNTFLDGMTGRQSPLKSLILPEVAREGSQPFTRLHIFNPSATVSAEVELKLYNSAGAVVATRTLTLAPRASHSEELGTLMSVTVQSFQGGYVEVSASSEVVAFELFGNADALNALSGQPKGRRQQLYWIPHFGTGSGFETELNFISVETEREATLRLTALDDQGLILAGASNPVEISLKPGEQKILKASSLFGFSSTGFTVGAVRVEARTAFGGPFAGVPDLNGSVRFKTQGGRLSASLPLVLEPQSSTLYPHVAEGLGFYTGVAVMNPNVGASEVTVEVFKRDGSKVGSASFTLASGGRRARLLHELVAETVDQVGGYFRVLSNTPLISFALFGDVAGQSLSAIPAQ